MTDTKTTLPENVFQAEVRTKELFMFTCNLCKPRRIFTEIEAHALHSAEIHKIPVSYKSIMLQYYGPDKFQMYGLAKMTEIQIFDLLNRYNAMISKKK
jgi:hypothetical protein